MVLTRPGEGIGAARLLSMPDRKSVNSCSRGVKDECVSQEISAGLRFRLFNGSGGSTGPEQPMGDVAEAIGEDTFTAAEGSARERRAPACAAVGGVAPAPAAAPPNAAAPGFALGGSVNSWERSNFGRIEPGELISCASLGFLASSPLGAPDSPGPDQKSRPPFLALLSSSSASLAASTAMRGLGRPLVAWASTPAGSADAPRPRSARLLGLGSAPVFTLRLATCTWTNTVILLANSRTSHLSWTHKPSGEHTT